RYVTTPPAVAPPRHWLISSSGSQFGRAIIARLRYSLNYPALGNSSATRIDESQGWPAGWPALAWERDPLRSGKLARGLSGRGLSGSAGPGATTVLQGSHKSANTTSNDTLKEEDEAHELRTVCGRAFEPR